MWPLWLIITVAAAVAAVVIITGILLAVTLEGKRHSQLSKTRGLARSLSSYHRPKLSANERNYSHVTVPTTNLRRSIRMPYGVVSLGSETNVGEDEEKQSEVSNIGIDDYTEVLQPQSNRRMQRSFSGSPLRVPKTRRPGKLRKPNKMELRPKSPLSAITEFGDPPTSAPPDVYEFPTLSTIRLIPGNTAAQPEKHIPTQWPLVLTETRDSRVLPTKVMEVVARESVLMRKGGAPQSHKTGSRFGRVPSSISEASMNSIAPEEPLSPLPPSDVHKKAISHDLSRRLSSISMDTVGSSVLGAFTSSPLHNQTGAGTTGRARGCHSPAFDITLKREFKTPQLQAPPVKKTIHGLVSGKSIRSLHPSVETDDPSLDRNDQHVPQLPTIVIRADQSFKTIDASTWNLAPLKMDKNRYQASLAQRHSMIEPTKLSQWRAVSDPMTGLLAEDDVFAIGAALQRPRSVATGNPQQWDRLPSSSYERHSLTSLEGPKRGHKRQNCVRIANLPILEPKPSLHRLPQLKEEQRPEPKPQSGSIFEIKQPWPRKAKPLVAGRKMSASLSPFKNAPILTPIARPLRKQCIQSPVLPSTVLRSASGTPRPVSEVFNFNDTETLQSSPYNNTPGHWPLSPNANTGVDTPPSARTSERTPFESPILPSPALNSAFLYPRKSLVKGPRSPRNSAQNHHTTSTSPLQNKQGHHYRVTKDRDSKNHTDTALDKSVMLLRSMNSEVQLLDQQHSQTYRSVGGDISLELPALPTLPLNKRVMGLRTSGCAPSITSRAPSPTLERQQSLLSRQPSPLASTSPSNLNILYRNGATNPKADIALDLTATPHLSMSPSFRITSMMSSSGASIWEDMSVRAESPEPFGTETQNPLSPENENGGTPASSASRPEETLTPTQRVLYPSRSSSYARIKSQQPTLSVRDFGISLHEEDEENIQDNPSLLVQRIERVANSGQWNHRTVNREDIELEPMTPKMKRELDLFYARSEAETMSERGSEHELDSEKLGADRRNQKSNASASRKERGVGLELGLGLGKRLDDLVVGKSYIKR